MPEPVSALRIDLQEIFRRASELAAPSGPQWSHESEDLDMTLLSWEQGRRIAPHINSEVDVVWICLEGTGRATVNAEVHEMRPGMLLLIPKGSERGVESTSERFCYLSFHRRRLGLRPTWNGRPV